MDVVYSDPKDSKLYQVPGGDPKQKEDVLYKVYAVSGNGLGGREGQYCRPYMSMFKVPPSTEKNQISTGE